MSIVVAEDAKFQLERMEIAGRDGTVETRLIVRHPGAVVIVPVLSNGDLVFVENERFAIERTLLELPAGTLEPGEAPEPAAHRELEEETGYRAAALTPLGGFYSAPGFSDEYLHVFVARDLTKTEMKLDPTERLTPRTLTFAEARQRVRQRAIEDAKTLAALLFYFDVAAESMVTR